METPMNKILDGAREAVTVSKSPCFGFVIESNMIEGIYRVTASEIEATENFLAEEEMSLAAICATQAVYAPGMPLRDRDHDRENP